jgi:hypothetical protein
MSPPSTPPRPKGDTIIRTDPASMREWAAWLDIDETKLLHLIDIVGPSAGQLEYVLGKNEQSRW